MAGFANIPTAYLMTSPDSAFIQNELVRPFHTHYGTTTGIRLFRAPGRVNLIGEHTDYNLGLVLPIGLDLACYVVCGPSADDGIRVYSQRLNESKRWNAASIGLIRASNHWSDYVAGVAQVLVNAGYEVRPSSIYIRSQIPIGSGLGSSAAVEVACAMALLGDQQIDRLSLAQLCRHAEVTFVGVPCGIMDQYIAVFAEPHVALKIDCLSLTHEKVTIPAGVSIVLVNSMVKHAHAHLLGIYRERTLECEEALRFIRGHKSSTATLRDITTNDLMLMTIRGDMPAVLGRRIRHIITENDRVRLFVEACKRQDLRRMGKLLLDSHESLRKDYEVSCEELDFLVNMAREIDGVYGSRMMGGGLGGCTLNLVRPTAVLSFKETISRRYAERFSQPQVHICRDTLTAGEIPYYDQPSL